MTKQAERHRKLKDESRGVDKCGPKWPGRGPKRASDRPETLGHGSAATRFACGAGDGNRSRTVSLGTDSLQGHSPRWLRARVMARVPFSDANEPVSYTHLRAHETRHDLVC